MDIVEPPEKAAEKLWALVSGFVMRASADWCAHKGSTEWLLCWEELVDDHQKRWGRWHWPAGDHWDTRDWWGCWWAAKDGQCAGANSLTLGTTQSPWQWRKWVAQQLQLCHLLRERDWCSWRLQLQAGVFPILQLPTWPWSWRRWWMPGLQHQWETEKSTHPGKKAWEEGWGSQGLNGY